MSRIQTLKSKGNNQQVQAKATTSCSSLLPEARLDRLACRRAIPPVRQQAHVSLASLRTYKVPPLHNPYKQAAPWTPMVARTTRDNLIVESREPTLENTNSNFLIFTRDFKSGRPQNLASRSDVLRSKRFPPAKLGGPNLCGAYTWNPNGRAE